MKINIYSIVKPSKDSYDDLCEHFVKSSQPFAAIQRHMIFNKKVSKAHALGKNSSQALYDELLSPHLKNAFNVALDVNGKVYNTDSFSTLLTDRLRVNFFIGGAFGFNEAFLNRCDIRLSLSQLTLAHKVAQLVLCEQLFRGLSLIHNHPYHK